jgi:hypothetical protein
MSQITTKPVEWKTPSFIKHLGNLPRAATDGCDCGHCDEINYKRKTERCYECFAKVTDCYCS